MATLLPLALEPVAMLDSIMVKRENQPATQVIVHGKNSFLDDAKWKFLFALHQKYPEF